MRAHSQVALFNFDNFGMDAMKKVRHIATLTTRQLSTTLYHMYTLKRTKIEQPFMRP